MWLISIRPEYARAILAGQKTVELRRRASSALRGERLAIYETAPTMAVVGTAACERVEALPLDDLWRNYGKDSGVSRATFDAYFDGTTIGNALILTDIKAFAKPIAASDLSESASKFHPPQSYRRLAPHEQHVIEKNSR